MANTRDNARSPTDTVSATSCGCSDHSGSGIEPPFCFFLLSRPRGGGRILLPGKRRNRDAHIALGVSDDAEILVVESDAEQAQIVDRDRGGDTGDAAGELGGGSRHALL